MKEETTRTIKGQRFHWTAIAGAAFILLASQGAGAANPSQAGSPRGGFLGEEMLVHCRAEEKDPVKDFARGLCIGFIDGFIAGHQVAETYHGFHHRDERMDDIFGHLCIPEGIGRGQLARVFLQFLQKTPERLKQPAGLLLEDAFREAYPCPK